MKPQILITTSSKPREAGLRRLDVVGGINYAEAILQTGGLPLFVANHDENLAEDYIAKADGLLLSGGADIDPMHYQQTPHQQLGLIEEARDHIELALYRAAKKKGIPILGVCRGIQVINVAEGGTLFQHLPAVSGTHQHGQRNIDGSLFHSLELTEGSLLAEAFGRSEVRTDSYHHQAIDQLGGNLRITARSRDGIIEAVEGTAKSFVLGVQWHPEMSFERYPEQIAPFRLFMDAVKKQHSSEPQIVSV